MSSPPSPPFSDIYVLRQVAESSEKPCSVCFKPTVWVLVEQSTKRDWFYVCKLHLRDALFASPAQEEKPDVAAATAPKPSDREIEEVTRLYNERKKKDKKSNDNKEPAKDNNAKDEDKNDDKGEESKIKGGSSSGWLSSLTSWTKGSDSASGTSSPSSPVVSAPEPEPKVFKLHRDIYKMRVQKFRDRTQTKRTAQLLRDPSMFPSVPKTDL